MTARPFVVCSVLALGLWFGACSSGLGNNLPADPTPLSNGSSNLPFGLDLGLVPTDPLAEPAVAGVVVPGIGGGADREVLLFGFSTAAPSDNGNGTGTRLARETTTDSNGAADVFVAAIAADAVETRAFSQSLAGKFRHPRCVTCHSMQAADTQAFVSSPQPHAGPPPGPLFPNNDPTTCAPCHVTSNTFPVPSWQAPAASFDIRGKTVAQIAAMAQNVPAGETEHFTSDLRVLWALDSGILPQVGGRNGVADDDHDGVLEPEDIDGIARPVPGGSVAFLQELEDWNASGNVVTAAAAVQDVALVSRAANSDAAANGTSTAPRLLWVPNPGFNPTTAITAAATNPIGTLYVVYQSTATDLIGADANGATDVFRGAIELRAEEDAEGNASAGSLNLQPLSAATILASARNGTTAVGNGDAARATIGGANGEWIAFESLATDLVAGFTDGNGPAAADVYVRHVTTDETFLLSHTVGNAATGGSGASEAPAVDPTGVAVAFESLANDLVAADGNGVRDVFYARIDAGSPFGKVRASVATDGSEGSGGASSAASIHVAGSRVRIAYQSDKTDLVAAVGAPTNVYLFDSATGGSSLLNQQVAPDGAALGDGSARAPAITADGATVAFESDATNIDVLRADGNRATDVFVVELAQVAAGLVLPFRISVTGSAGADGNAGSTRPAIGSFTGSASYQVGFAAYLTDANNLGTSDSTNVMLAFLDETSGVIAEFTATPVRGAIPLVVQFTDQSSGSPTSWAWDFDDDGTIDSTAQNPTHTYTTAGTFSVRFVAQNANTEGTKTSANLIRALGPVVADFTTSATTGTAPVAITFTDTSTEEPDTWAWDFENDGIVDSTLQNPTHNYTVPGTYTVTLTATGEGGAGTVTKADLVTVFAPVVASFTRTPTAGVVPFAVTFTDTTTGSPTSWAWDFENDGIVDSTLQNPIFTYTSAGNYAVRLSATGPGGTNAFTFTNCVSAAGPVQADFSSVRSAYNDTAVQFTDLSTGTITDWAWDFDNNGTTDSILQNPTHTYSTPGTYSVRLTASGPGGTDSETKLNWIVSVPASVAVVLDASKDTSIYSESANSNGANVQIVCGNAASLAAVQVGIRRAMVEFDVSGSVPSGATILSAQLQLTSTFAPLNTTGAQTVSLRRLTREWGEAGSNSGVTVGGGAVAQAGDANWANAVVGTTAWTTAGGDFVAGISRSTSVNAAGTYTWNTNATMVADVQEWLDTPANNHGWILRAGETSGVRTAKVFDSRESATPANRPKLNLTYRPALP